MGLSQQGLQSQTGGVGFPDSHNWQLKTRLGPSPTRKRGTKIKLTFQQWQFFQFPVLGYIESRGTLPLVFLDVRCSSHWFDFCQLCWGRVIVCCSCVVFPLLQYKDTRELVYILCFTEPLFWLTVNFLYNPCNGHLIRKYTLITVTLPPYWI